MAQGGVVSELLVEGQNDRHVISALCEQHNVVETFSIFVCDGIDKLLAGIPVRLKQSGFQTLGIVLDADQELQARWDSVCNRLKKEGYHSLPQQPEPHGSIITLVGKPKVGIWIMPDNQVPGMLENFVAHLIPANDGLSNKANRILDEIETANLHRYIANYRPKAFIHTWLAWQETPGRPMGQAITSRVLQSDSQLAVVFVNWLNRLFNQGE